MDKVIIFRRKIQERVQHYRKSNLKKNYYFRSLQMHLKVHLVLSATVC